MSVTGLTNPAQEQTQGWSQNWFNNFQSTHPDLQKMFNSPNTNKYGTYAGIAGIAGAALAPFFRPNQGGKTDLNPYFAQRNQAAQQYQYGMGKDQMNRYMNTIGRRLMNRRNQGSMASEMGARTGLGGFYGNMARQQNIDQNNVLVNSFLQLLDQNEQMKRQGFQNMSQIDQAINQAREHNAQIDYMNRMQNPLAAENLLNSVGRIGALFAGL
jgi:hypothetical protein